MAKIDQGPLSRSQMFSDLKGASKDIQQLHGWQKASIRRMIKAESPGVGLPPTDAYESGLTDLPVIASFVRSSTEEGPVAPTTCATMQFEFWNVEVTPGDEILFGGEVFVVCDITSRSERLVMADVLVQSGETVLEKQQTPDAAVAAMCLVWRKPPDAISLRLNYTDNSDEARVSDEIEFGADCSVGDVVVVRRDGETADVKDVTDVNTFSGELGLGVIKVLDKSPFRSQVTATKA